VGLDDPAADGEAEAAAGNMGAPVAVEAEEVVEDLCALGGGHAGPAVGDADQHLGPGAERLDADRLARRPVLLGILEQVPEHLRGQGGVEVEQRQVG
jgi:hypothetical protein